MDKIRLLIASEDYSLSRGLSAIFAAESLFEVIGSFPYDEAIHSCMELQPDAVLLDMSRDLVRHEAQVEQIRKECPCSMIFVLVDQEQVDHLGVLIQGIDGIIPKGIMRGCLVKTLELACQAGVFCLPASLKKKVSCCTLEKNVSLPGLKSLELGNNETLTRREAEILQLMAQNFSNRQIANNLYISEPTVKTHVSNILRKLGINNRAEAIIFSYQMGLVEQPNVAAKWDCGSTKIIPLLDCSKTT